MDEEATIIEICEICNGNGIYEGYECIECFGTGEIWIED